MPVYSYKCFNCKKEFEKLVKLGQKITHCPECNKLAEKVFSGKGVNIIMDIRRRDVE